MMAKRWHHFCVMFLIGGRWNDGGGTSLPRREGVGGWPEALAAAN